MPDPSKREKKKNLTLGLSKEVIDKAKAAGINISEITEELLNAVTYNPSEGSTWIGVERAYDELFDTMKPLLSKYDISIEVGREEFYKSQKKVIGTIMITKENLIEVVKNMDGIEDSSPIYVGDAFHSLYEPEKILENLITSLISRVEKNNERVKELDVALHFVQGLWLSDYYKEDQVS